MAVRCCGGAVAVLWRCGCCGGAVAVRLLWRCGGGAVAEKQAYGDGVAVSPESPSKAIPAFFPKFLR